MIKEFKPGRSERKEDEIKPKRASEHRWKKEIKIMGNNAVGARDTIKPPFLPRFKKKKKKGKINNINESKGSKRDSETLKRLREQRKSIPTGRPLARRPR